MSSNKTQEEEEEELWNELTSDIFTITSGVQIISVLTLLKKEKDDLMYLCVTGKNKNEYTSFNLCTIKKQFDTQQNREIYKLRNKFKVRRLSKIEVNEEELSFSFLTDKITVYVESFDQRNEFIYTIIKVISLFSNPKKRFSNKIVLTKFQP
jgi:hypothetical protein